MANIAVQRIKREFKEVLKSEEHFTNAIEEASMEATKIRTTSPKWAKT